MGVYTQDITTLEIDMQCHADGPKSESGRPDLGLNADLRGYRLFPPDNPWNQDISRMPVDRRSSVLIASIGLNESLHPDFGSFWNGAPNGIPYVVVGGSQLRRPVRFLYEAESDPGPYPAPPDAPVEGGPNSNGDRHVLVLDRDHEVLYELFRAFPHERGAWWSADSGAVFPLRRNSYRPPGWTSADAAGLPILPGLVRYDEVQRGEVRHALRFTCTRTRRAYTHPARHFASRLSDPQLPPMGMRVRLKADVNISTFPLDAQVILFALKRYGMILADNGGNWFVSGAPHPRWNDETLGTLRRITGKDFEVVRMGRLVTG